eukprot:9475418-Pyramimonas_sp.AAC.1
MSQQPEPPGMLQQIAATMLMNMLHGARMAGFVLLRAVGHAASCVTKLMKQWDVGPFRLRFYTKATLHYRVVSRVGDDLWTVQISLYSDADLARDARAHRKTSARSFGGFARGPARASQSMAPRSQTCVSHGTLEAKLVAVCLALRTQLLTSLPSREMQLQRAATCFSLEDNHA